MANAAHRDVLMQGVTAWNQWRKRNPKIRPDLSKVRLDDPKFSFTGINLREADLSGAHLRNANLACGDLSKADLIRADLGGATLADADLSRTDLRHTELPGADLDGASLIFANLVDTRLQKATITNCRIYGISTWDVQLEGAKQSDLIITRPNEPTVTVDDLEVAQFIYLLLTYRKLRSVIETVARKAVLILGRFVDGRKEILDAVKEGLRGNDPPYLPIVFDFDRPVTHRLIETVRLLAHLSRFIIADITDPRSVPHELASIVPGLMTPVQPLLEANRLEELNLDEAKLDALKRTYSMFEDLRVAHDWVLPVHLYKDCSALISSLSKDIIAPIEAKAKELEKRKAMRALDL